MKRLQSSKVGLNFDYASGTMPRSGSRSMLNANKSASDLTAIGTSFSQVNIGPGLADPNSSLESGAVPMLVEPEPVISTVADLSALNYHSKRGKFSFNLSCLRF